MCKDQDETIVYNNFSVTKPPSFIIFKKTPMPDILQKKLSLSLVPILSIYFICVIQRHLIFECQHVFKHIHLFSFLCLYLGLPTVFNSASFFCKLTQNAKDFSPCVLVIIQIRRIQLKSFLCLCVFFLHPFNIVCLISYQFLSLLSVHQRNVRGCRYVFFSIFQIEFLQQINIFSFPESDLCEFI